VLNSYALDFLAHARHRRLLDEAARDHVAVDPGEDNMAHFDVRGTIKRVVPAAIGAFALAAVVMPNATVANTTGENLTNVRDATAGFSDATAALAAGYELFTDAADLACIDQAGMGAMGIHYRKAALMQSGKLDPARPQALVYQRSADGRLQLGAVEYVVLQSDWDANHSAPPSLFGQEFMLMPADNRFGLPPFYQLHAWIWRTNPAGVFTMWNPDLTCAEFPG
jgi:hypothetical protein